ncbi:MAG TPA: hypothetical protein VF607_14990, partial [Verrucomicrobiae bacterium]
PRAQANWKNLVFFDYPITWDPALLEFEGYASGTVNLPILTVGSRLKLLNESAVDFDFNQDLNLALPHIKALDLLNNTINGPFITLSNAIYQELKGTADATGLTTGLRSLQGVLNQDAHAFFGPILNPAFDGLASNLVVSLKAFPATNPAVVIGQVAPVIASLDSQFRGTVARINGTVGQVDSVLGQLDVTYTNIDDTIGLLQRILEPDAAGNRHVLRTIVEKLVQDQSPELSQIFTQQGAALDSVVNNVLADYDTEFSDLSDKLEDLRYQLNNVHNGLLQGAGPVVTSLNAITNDLAALQDFEQNAFMTVSNYLGTVLAVCGDYFTADPGAAQAKLRQQLEDAFLGSLVTGEYQTKFRQFLGDDDFLLNQLLCIITDKINRAVRDSVENNLAGSSDNIFQLLNGLGEMNKNLATAKLRGQPQFKGDTLELIHLDADLEMHLPDAFHYNAYIEIRNLNSQASPVACAKPGTDAAEIVLGANRVPLQLPGQAASGLALSLNGRWCLENGAITGLGGLMEVDGKADFEGFQLRKMGVTFAFGQADHYLAGAAEAVVLIGPVPVELNAAIFAGHACSLDPLLYVDTNAPAILGGVPDFTGCYIKFGGGISLSDLLLGNSTCMLNLDARLSNTEFANGSWLSAAQRFGYFY